MGERRGRWTFSWDVVIVAVLVVPAALAYALAGGRSPDGGSSVALAAGTSAAVALVWRRRAAIAVLIATAACAVGSLAVVEPSAIATVAVGIALYTVASTHANSTTMWWCVGTTGCLTAAAVFAAQLALTSPYSVGVLAGLPIAAAVGASVRANRRSAMAQACQQAAQEQLRLQQVRGELAAQRLRLAADLHDDIAHHIAIISVQAGAADHLRIGDPDGLARSIGHIQAAAQAALEGLASTIGVLREPSSAVSADITFTADSIAALLDTFRITGHDIACAIGDLPPLTARASTVAYLVLREALTNAVKHGRPPVTIDIRSFDDQLDMTIANSTKTDPPATVGGHGLPGMRDRLAAVDGTLHIEHTGRRFILRVMFPVAAKAVEP